MKNQNEIWKDIYRFKKLYQVSNFGRIKSLKRCVNHPKGIAIRKEKILKLKKYNDSAIMVSLQINKKIKKVEVHRTVYETFNNIKLNSNQIIDHKDGNHYNNKINNLRLCTQHQNTMNNRSNKGNSKFKGVYFYKSRNKWCSYIHFNYKKIHIGYFNSEIEAGKAYNEKAKKLFGEFACLNNVMEF